MKNSSGPSVGAADATVQPGARPKARSEKRSNPWNCYEGTPESPRIMPRELRRRFAGPAGRESAADLADALDAVEERLAGLLGLGGQSLHRFHPPVPEHDRHEDLVVVHLQVVDAGA